MTRITIELTAVDDCCAMRLLRTVQSMMFDAYVASTSITKAFGPGYGVSDTDGSCECKVTHEDNGIERGMEVTL